MIVSIAALTGMMNGRKTAAYYASKAGLVNLTRALAAEWGGTYYRECDCPRLVPEQDVAWRNRIGRRGSHGLAYATGSAG